MHLVLLVHALCKLCVSFLVMSVTVDFDFVIGIDRHMLLWHPATVYYAMFTFYVII